MIGRKSFEEMGRDADAALRAAATAKNTVISVGSAEAMAAKISVVIQDADWQNGLYHLRDHLTEVVRERIAELLPQAVSRMERKAREGVEALRVAFEAGDHLDGADVRQVPREGFAGRDPMSGFGTGYTDARQVMEHDQSVDQTPPASSASAAGSAAPSGPVGRTDAPATSRRLQPADFITPFAVGNAQVTLDRQEAELFEQVVSGNAKVPARGPQATKLLRYGLVEKSDTSATAVLRLTGLGETLVAGLTAATAEDRSQ